MTRLWMPDELTYAGPEHLDPDYVAGYDRKAGFDPAHDVAILRRHGIDDRSTVVDLGAGTGAFALAIAPYVHRVVAADVSPAMLAHLGAEAVRRNLGNVECVRAGFLSYHHEGPAPDAVFSRHALHQLPDFWKAIALHRIAELLRPGGVFRLRDLIYDFRPADATGFLDDWLAGAGTDPAAGYVAEEYATHLRTEFSTYRWLFEPMLAAAGREGRRLTVVDVRYRQRIYGAYTCVLT